MKTPNVFWIKLDQTRIIKKETISYIFWDKEEKQYQIKIAGVTHYFNKKDGDKILKAIGAL